MKVLLVGGAAQGKGDYAVERYGVTPADLVAGELRGGVLYGAHLLVRRLLDEDREPGTAILEQLSDRQDWVVLCDEIGAGVVPIDGRDRRWREETGRLCCELARCADVVERIVCGIGLRLKGGATH